MPLSEILQKFNPLERQSPANEFYLCLVISDEKVKSGIWSPYLKDGELLSFGSLESWSGNSAEELIVVADTSIATGVSKLQEVSEQQPTKTILGLPENWVEGNLIVHEKLVLLEKVCKKLLLKPQGFIVTAEAVAHLLKKNEGGLPSAILVNIEETQIGVSLIKAGKFSGTRMVGRSDNLALDLEEGILRFDFQEDLPSRIILVNSEDLETAKQSLLSYPWISPEKTKKLHFLQLPKVESAPLNLEVSAVIFASSREFGKTEEINPKEDFTASGLESQETQEPTIESIVEEDFGFVGESDLTKAQAKETEAIKVETEIEDQENIKTKETLTVKPTGQILNSFKRVLKYVLSINPLFLFKKAIIAPLGVLVVLSLILLGIFGTIKSEIRLLATPWKAEKEFNFIVSPQTTSVDAEKMILPAKEIIVDVSGEKKSNVTGKKTVGDKAKGEIILFNRTDQIKIVSKGVVLKSPAGLKFVLVEEIKIGSKSADLEKGIDKWGEAIGKVIALDIGTQFNIVANTPLSLESVSPTVLLVKNPQAFSGGTSREIQAVSKEDRENLLRDLGKELEEKAKKEIENKISADSYMLSASLLLKSKTDRFNHEVEDEATEIILEENSQFSALYFQKEDFSALVKKVIVPLIPEGFKKDPVRQTENFELKDKAKGIYLAKVVFECLPEINTDEIVNNLRFKTFTQAEEYLRKVSQVSGVTIIIKPQIFSKARILPLLKKNITIVVESI